MLRRDVSRAGEAGRDGGLQDDGGDQEPNVGVSSSSGAHTHTHSLSLSLGHAHRHTLISFCLSSVTLRAKRWEVPTTNTISFFLGIGGKRSSFALSLSSLSPHRDDEVPQSVDADRHDTVTLTGAACVCRVCCVCVCVWGVRRRVRRPRLCVKGTIEEVWFFFLRCTCVNARRVSVRLMKVKRLFSPTRARSGRQKMLNILHRQRSFIHITARERTIIIESFYQK